MPAFARQVAEVSTRVIGFAFAVNTAVIVGLQFFVLGRITGRRRTRVFMVTSTLWGVLAGARAQRPGARTLAASAAVLVFMALFALGETMLQPTVPASERPRPRPPARRYMPAAQAPSSGTILGPVVAGLLLEHRLAGVYIGMLVGGARSQCRRCATHLSLGSVRSWPRRHSGTRGQPGRAVRGQWSPRARLARGLKPAVRPHCPDHCWPGSRTIRPERS